jgi:heme/copper-type cytochrome/quinol oxidase subunit 2
MGFCSELCGYYHNNMAILLKFIDKKCYLLYILS